MREIPVNQVIDLVERLCIEANSLLGRDIAASLEEALAHEESPLGRDILQQLLDNAALARQTGGPMCQDTGVAVVFVEIGEEVHVAGGSLENAINEGVRRGYLNGYLRKSVVSDPLFKRKNTGDNTPAVIHYRLVAGDKLRITVAPKGAGSENMSGLKMLKPSDGVEGLKRFVLEIVDSAGSNPCPPIVVGVGVGGTMEKAALLAKEALVRPINQRHPDAAVAQLEQELLELINQLGIGPQGLGGRFTALAVNIEIFPTHIACLPVAVNINCHCTRHAEGIL
ncbi:MAG: fumarate hydratase [Firmicutes bacterium]|nr:fumarate hydratase [Bacillota bacterium]